MSTTDVPLLLCLSAMNTIEEDSDGAMDMEVTSTTNDDNNNATPVIKAKVAADAASVIGGGGDASSGGGGGGGGAHDNSLGSDHLASSSSCGGGGDDSVTFRSLLKKFPHSSSTYLDARPSGEASGLDRPIGVCLLPSGNVVVSSSGDHSVRMFSPDLTPLSPVRPPPGRAAFDRPSDLAALPDGRFAVRDDAGVSLFDEGGLFLQGVADGAGVFGRGSRCFGLAADGRGHLYTICSGARGAAGADIVRIDVATGEVQYLDISLHKVKQFPSRPIFRLCAASSCAT